jgi:hypothetical protein
MPQARVQFKLLRNPEGLNVGYDNLSCTPPSEARGIDEKSQRFSEKKVKV